MVNYDGLYHSDAIDKHSCFSQKELGFKIIENGTILPDLNNTNTWGWGKGGIFDSEGNFVNSSYVVDTQIMEPYTPEEEVPFFDTTVIYLAMYYRVWGHCMTDMIRRVWFLKTDVYKENFSSCPIILNDIHGGGGIIPQFLDLLKILEINLDKVELLDKPARFQKIIFPDDSFKRGMFTKEYVETIDIARNYAQKNFNKLSQKNFFFHYNKGIRYGSARLAKYFDSKGFEVIRPENFSVKDQLNILANCERFASTVGSCSHNSVFLKDHTEVLLIPRSAARLNNTAQIVLDQMHDKNTFYIDSTLSIFDDRSNGAFCYLISKQLRDYFGEKILQNFSRDDLEIFLDYFQELTKRGFVILPISSTYYAEVMTLLLEELKHYPDLKDRYSELINIGSKNLETTQNFLKEFEKKLI